MKNNETEFANQDEEISKGMDYKQAWEGLKKVLQEEVVRIYKASETEKDENDKAVDLITVNAYVTIYELLERIENGGKLKDEQ